MKKLITVFLAIISIFPVFAQTNRNKQTAIALINFLGTQAALIQKYQEDSPTLEDIYNRIENYTQPEMFGSESTRVQIRNLFNNITSFQIFDIRRDRIRVIRENAKARAIQQAIPSPVFFLSLASNIRDPLALVVNIVGMAAQSVTSYMSATERADLQAYVEYSKLTEQQKGQVNNLRSYMYDYMSRTAREFTLTENYDTVSREAITAFVDNITIPNLTYKLNFLLLHQATYQNYAPYWLDLANTYYDLKRYSECLASIERYESIRVPIFRPNCDYDYAQTLTKGIMALSNVYSGEQYKERCIAFLKKIEANAPFAEWAIRYAAALAYLDLASKSSQAERRALLTNAYQLLKGNMVDLIKKEKDAAKKYIEPLVVPPKEATKGVKDAYDRANKARKTELPPYNYALYSNFFALYGVMEQLSMPDSERKEIAAMTKEVFLIPDFRVKYLNEGFEEAYDNYFNVFDVNTRFSITRPLIGNSKLQLSLPSLFFLSGSTFSISINQIFWNNENPWDTRKTQIFNIDKISPTIKNVNRLSFSSYDGPNEFYLGAYQVDAEFDLRQKVNLDKKNDYIVTITIDNLGPLAVLRFQNDRNSLDFSETVPISVSSLDNEGNIVEVDIGVEDAIKAVTNRSNPGIIFGPQSNPKIASIIKGLEQYLVSERYRYTPAKNKTLNPYEAKNYTDSDRIDLLATFIVGYFVFDLADYTGIYMETSNYEKTANIIIVHPDRKVEFRCYEK